MRDITEDTLYDVRLIERHMKEGILKQEELDAHLAKIPDSESKSSMVNVDELRTKNVI
ncbi:MAG: hypothetical protein VYA34_01490 [Myxococcota bacterium]|nr:hypothetical protein [Myxococcota bacterium]